MATFFLLLSSKPPLPKLRSEAGKRSSTAPRPATAPRSASASRPATPQAANVVAATTSQGPELAAVGSRSTLNSRPATATTAAGRPPLATAASPRPATAEAAATAADWVTTNEQFYGFRDLYPELYEAAASATKALPAPNLAFKSEYSESLKKGSGEYWKQFLQTTNERLNKAVHKPNKEYQARKDAGFYYWLRKQRLYYGDFLTEVAATRLDAALEAADTTGKAELLAATRILFAIIQPNRCAPLWFITCLGMRRASLHLNALSSQH